MLNIKFHNRSGTGKSYLYKIELELLGRAVEFGFSFHDLEILKETLGAIVSEPKELKAHLHRLQERMCVAETISKEASRSRKTGRRNHERIVNPPPVTH